jgi:acyl-CoA reductase-like NAD-dependent aldehyde dehydrogenase
MTALVNSTPPADVSAAVARARSAQPAWAALPIRDRLAPLDAWYRRLAASADAWADRLVHEIGKPRPEAVAEVLSTLDQMRWVRDNARRVLADERLPRGRQFFQLVPPARLAWAPLGVIGIIGTWNYPLYLNAPAIAAALSAGNAVVWKPSELAPQSGLDLQNSLDGLLPDPSLAQAVYGDGPVGAALTASGIDKGHFTGGVPVGRRFLADLAARGIPAVAELSGFDPALVRPDADLARTIPPLAWAAFIGAGQTCVAVKRVYVVGNPAPWAAALAEKAKALRLGDPAQSDDIDVGPLISPQARDRFDAYVQKAVAAGAKLLAGGVPVADSTRLYPPTVLLADPGNTAPESALAGCFGPVVIVRGVASDDEAVAAANASDFGLAASVWGRDRRAAKAVARRLQAGMVAVNEAVTPLAHAAAPFGGVKASGFGRVHGDIGLRECASPQVIHVRRAGGFRPQVYPYAARSARTLRAILRWFHPTSS